MKLSPAQIFKDKNFFFIGGAGVVGKFLLWLIIFSSLTGQTFACEPAVPLGQLALFPGAIAKSLYLLAATVLLKAFAFAFLEKTLVWWKAIIFILLANIFSTIVGVVSVIPLSMPSCLPIFILTFFLSIIPARGLAQRYFPGKQDSKTYIIASILTFISFASMISFTFAKGAIETGRLGTYWAAKIICVYLGLIFGIVITIFYEEWLTAKLAKRRDFPTPFLTSVTRANLIALLFMMIVTAVVVIPEKIQNQDYGFLR
jgi:hypothetical protein